MAKICVSLLRYCANIRLDRLYYEAGVSCQKANQIGMASIFLNRYLDINELIDDPDNNNLGDNNEFDVTDIPSPYDVNMPIKNFLSSQEKEKIRDWLLQVYSIFNLGQYQPKGRPVLTAPTLREVQLKNLRRLNYLLQMPQQERCLCSDWLPCEQLKW